MQKPACSRKLKSLLSCTRYNLSSLRRLSPKSISITIIIICLFFLLLWRHQQSKDIHHCIKSRTTTRQNEQVINPEVFTKTLQDRKEREKEKNQSHWCNLPAAKPLWGCPTGSKGPRSSLAAPPLRVTSVKQRPKPKEPPAPPVAVGYS